MNGLTLVPTPIHDALPLEPVALERLRTAANDPESLILVEELKAVRARWLRWGLPRETIPKFIPYNEHGQDRDLGEVLSHLKSGKPAVLLSDCGLPAFCDPGQALVDACHEAGIRVTATPFPNSIALAIALSGFPHRRFFFAGFLPADSRGRTAELERLTRIDDTIVIMDTPYRLQALLEDLSKSGLRNRPAFLACHLNAPEERLERGSLLNLLREARNLGKPEFVLLIRANDQKRN
jgi:16S rRNA (cytidine1402-2'-O)-methyltransferase